MSVLYFVHHGNAASFRQAAPNLAGPAGQSPVAGILSAQESPDSVLYTVYYPPAIVSSIDASQNAVGFILNPPDYLALVPGQAVTAGTEPGSFPAGEAISSSQSWAPSVQAWLSGVPLPPPTTPGDGPVPVPPPIVVPESLNMGSTSVDQMIQGAMADPYVSAADTAPMVEQFYRRKIVGRQAQACTMAARTGYTACSGTAVDAQCIISCAAGYYGASTKYQCSLVNGVPTFRNVTTVASCLPMTACSKYTCPGVLNGWWVKWQLFGVLTLDNWSVVRTTRRAVGTCCCTSSSLLCVCALLLTLARLLWVPAATIVLRASAVMNKASDS